MYVDRKENTLTIFLCAYFDIVCDFRTDGYQKSSPTIEKQI